MEETHRLGRWWTPIAAVALVLASVGVADAQPAPTDTGTFAASPGCGKTPTRALSPECWTRGYAAWVSVAGVGVRLFS